jgi:excinuclease ABC subunit A
MTVLPISLRVLRTLINLEVSLGCNPILGSSRLINVLKTLRDIGNTVIVVEHKENIMREADYIIDIGPDA